MWNDETSHCGGELCGTMKPVTMEVSCVNDEFSHCRGELCGAMPY